jgi:outer membrane protein OmpA-like peptidoglycan-associated protein
MHLVELRFVRVIVLVSIVTFASWLARPVEPAHGRVVVTDTETTILDVVEFEPGTATLRPSSAAILDAVTATLQGNESIELVEVQSHTRGTGDSAANLALSQQRAEVVMQYILDAGVVPERLVAQGYGDTQPIDTTVPAKNERVSFLILKRTSDDAR